MTLVYPRLCGGPWHCPASLHTLQQGQCSHHVLRAQPAAPSGSSDTGYENCLTSSVKAAWVDICNKRSPKVTASYAVHKSELRKQQASGFHSTDKWQQAISPLANSHFTQPLLLGLAGPSQRPKPYQYCYRKHQKEIHAQRSAVQKQHKLMRCAQPRIRMSPSPLWLAQSERRRIPAQGQQS